VGGHFGRILVLLATMLLFIVAAKCAPSENLTIIPASEILDKIQKGEPVEYDHVAVEGNLDIRKQNLQENENGLYYVTSPIIRITDSTINGAIYFSKTKFDGPVDFSNTNFKELVDFSKATFSTNASFSQATFDRDAYFTDTMFSSGVFFYSTIFRGPADFNRAIFQSYVYLYDSTFSGDAYFGEATFRGEVIFYNDAFRGYTTFMGAMFRDNAIISKSIFNEHADFSHATFISMADFSGDIFSNYADFRETSFVHVNFIGATFSGNINFDGATFGKYLNIERNINFIGAVLDKCSLRGLKSAADFSEATFKGYILGWEYIRNTVFDEATYLALINDFKDHGQFDDANDCYYTYRINNMNNLHDYLALVTCGFGVRWDYTIWLAFLFWIIFGITYYIKIDSVLGALMFSAVALFSFPKEVYGDGYDKIMNVFLTWDALYLGIINKIYYIRLLFALERLIGWIFLILFINTISRVMIHY
jgi:uncharacterized protein YjbI with pentapeptide repeats